MEKSVAIVTGASQGISRSTAIRLACDLSALVLVARGRTNLEATAEAVRPQAHRRSVSIWISPTRTNGRTALDIVAWLTLKRRAKSAWLALRWASAAISAGEAAGNSSST
jgi:NAD(P)-dependent dehydrogenase (short-subunit alcohol dehydrogenase family)